jgi:hypothetical protein
MPVDLALGSGHDPGLKRMRKIQSSLLLIEILPSGMMVIPILMLL